MRKACVIGWPIEHSRSPLIHNYWLKEYGISGVYEKHAIPPTELSNFIGSLSESEICGCNVTIPHKEKVFSLVTIQDELTRKIGAVNTVYLKSGKTCGLNTDGMGFIANLKTSIPDWDLSGKHCLVIGAGGAARAIIAALLNEHVSKLILVNRTVEKAQNLANLFGEKIAPTSFCDLDVHLRDTDLLVNTTSLGMTGQKGLSIDLDHLPEKSVVTDIVYSPLETTLLKDARLRGNPVVDGLGMLLHQAVPGFQKWFGVKPKVTPELRQLVLDDISKGTAK